MLLLLLACQTVDSDSPPPSTAPVALTAPGFQQPASPGSPPNARDGIGLDQGQQHPPLPADNPAWQQDVGGFVSSPQWYGEHDWEGVHMRTLGHLAVLRRDRARAMAEGGDLSAATQEYRLLVTDLSALELSEGQPPDQIRDLLQQAAERDAALCTALSDGTPLPKDHAGLYGLRVRYLEMARHAATGRDVTQHAQELAEDLRPYTMATADLEIDAFENFDARHALRVQLFQAALAAQDPLHLNEPWGYWTAEESALQGQALFTAVSAMAKGERLQGDPMNWPDQALKGLREPLQFTVEGLGWLPTGDSLIDVGAQPGPKAIGTLQKWGLDDPEHKARLERAAQELRGETDPEQVLAVLRTLLTELDAGGHGSRFYNVKQVRNEGVRVLASQGHYTQALALLSDNFPLHHQDWACPNRQGILGILQARL
ncbi:MAG: hypothetical protein ACI9VR_002250, partial [Cognaticolwellia sp.]